MAPGEKRPVWSPEKRSSFAREWNLGASAMALRERFGVKSSAGAAATLRRIGYALSRRRGGGMA